MGGIAGTLLFILAAVVLILYRNWKYEQELDSLLWKVNYKDIQIKEQKDETVEEKINEAPIKHNSKVIAACIFVKIFSIPTFPRIYFFIIFSEKLVFHTVIETTCILDIFILILIMS